MSLREAYSLAHMAQYRLSLEAGRSNRNLRLMVGHLNHIESLRQRIEKIEDDMSKSQQQSSSISFSDAATLETTPSRSQYGRRSPPPPPPEYYSEDESDSDSHSEYSDYEDDDLSVDDEFGSALALERFPSGSARTVDVHSTSSSSLNHSPPELEDDNSEDSDIDDEEYLPASPGDEPEQAMLEGSMKTNEHAHSHEDPLTEAFNDARKWQYRARAGSPCYEGVAQAVSEVMAVA